MQKKKSTKDNREKRSKRKNLEIAFYENLLKEQPDFVGALIGLGDVYTRKGYYKEGLEVDKKLVHLKPEDPVVRYNLACSLSLLGKSKEALEELKNAILLGYDEFSYILEDPDLENLRSLSEFKTFFCKLKKLET